MGSLCAVGERGIKTGLSCGHQGSSLLCCVTLGKTLPVWGLTTPTLKLLNSSLLVPYPLHRKRIGRIFLWTKELIPVRAS